MLTWVYFALVYNTYIFFLLKAIYQILRIMIYNGRFSIARCEQVILPLYEKCLCIFWKISPLSQFYGEKVKKNLHAVREWGRIIPYIKLKIYFTLIKTLRIYHHGNLVKLFPSWYRRLILLWREMKIGTNLMINIFRVVATVENMYWRSIYVLW